MCRVDEVLNRVLVCLARNLVQYINESYPWTEEQEDEQQVLQQIVSRQNQSIAKLVALLEAREATVDFGVYPDYTDYNYVALDSVLDRLVAAEKGLIAEIERAEKECQPEAEVAALLRELRNTELENLKQLEALAARRLAGQAQSGAPSDVVAADRTA